MNDIKLLNLITPGFALLEENQEGLSEIYKLNAFQKTFLVSSPYLHLLLWPEEVVAKI